tara:strand:- start:690 stop:1469 length:780 start_codon:yes stop_codon:yes gene_type:complete
MPRFSSGSELLDELRSVASKLRREGRLEFTGFSNSSLEHYENLYALGMDLDAYRETKETYASEVRPQIIALMSDLCDIISKFDRGFNDNPSDMVGLPCPHGNPRSYAWAAMTRAGRTRRNDLQFFVALKRKFLRFGIYASRKEGKERFTSVWQSIRDDEARFLELLEEANKSGYSLDTHREDFLDDGSMVPLIFDASEPHVSISEHGHFHLVRGTPLEDLADKEPEEILDSALHAFAHTRGIYEFCLSKRVVSLRDRVL